MPNNQYPQYFYDQLIPDPKFDDQVLQDHVEEQNQINDFYSQQEEEEQLQPQQPPFEEEGEEESWYDVYKQEDQYEYRTYQGDSEDYIRYDPGVDGSISAIRYLKALGYNSCEWVVNEPHDKKDVCDENKGRVFYIDDLIYNAELHKETHGYVYPPATIWHLSHPDCRCDLRFTPPTSYMDIPDDAPGLPITSDENVLIEHKKRLFEQLSTMWVSVSNVTYAPDYRWLHRADQQLVIVKQADDVEEDDMLLQKEWVDDIQPARILVDRIIKVDLDLLQPIMKDDIGFQLKTKNDRVLFYSARYNRVINVNREFIQHLQLVIMDETEPKPLMYVFFDDTYGIIHRILEGRIYCFVPEYETVVAMHDVDFKIMQPIS